MSRRQQWVYHIEPEEFSPDFPERLDAFRQAAWLSWRGLARRLKVSARQVFRWKAGAAQGSVHLVSRCSPWPQNWGCFICCCRRRTKAKPQSIHDLRPAHLSLQDYDGTSQHGG